MKPNHKLAIEFAITEIHMADEANLANAYIELREILNKIINADTDKELSVLLGKARAALDVRK